ncbi:MAG: carboxypeptidase regulatory-like domain-containing protein [Acidobacteriota bacterium]|nr:carboxypeptidase regulatory-like domain-containing protein [Acidobacteriota bacterium]
MSSISSRVAAVLALAVVFTSASMAQTADATLTGYVKDPSGAAVPNAKVTLKNSATGVAADTQTNDTGFYNFPYMVTPFGHAVELLPSQEVIREFNVQTNNLGAEYGGFAGGVVNMSTKSGTNELHGDLYEFLRNKILNSNNFFNNAHGVPTGAFTQNQFGATLGGPVVIPKLYNGKNKTFFFIDYEGFRLRQGLPVLLSVPTPAMRSGDFSGLGINIYNPYSTVQDPTNPKNYLRQQASCNGRLNVICPSQIDPVAAHLISLWGLPNVPGAGYINN